MFSKAEFWSIAAQLNRITTGAVFLIVAVKALSHDELSSWYLFLAIFGVVSIFASVLIELIPRYVGYLCAKEIKIPQISALNIDLLSFEKNIRAVAYGLFVITSLMFLLLSILNSIVNHEDIKLEIFVLWIMFSLGAFFNLANLYNASVCYGTNSVAGAQKNNIAISVLNACLMVSSIWISLYGVVFAYFLSSLFGYFAQDRLRRVVVCNSDGIISVAICKKIINVMYGDYKKLFVKSIGTRLSYPIFFILLSSFVSKEFMASYGLTMQILDLIFGVSLTILTANVSKISGSYASMEYKNLNIFFTKAFLKSLLSYGLMVCAVIFFGKDMLSSISSNTHLLDGHLLFLLIIFFSIETIVHLFTQYQTSAGYLMHSYYYFVSSLIMVLLVFTVLYIGFGVVEAFMTRIFIMTLLYLIPSLVELLRTRKILGITR